MIANEDRLGPKAQQFPDLWKVLTLRVALLQVQRKNPKGYGGWDYNIA
jgi:hypothetical protein